MKRLVVSAGKLHPVGGIETHLMHLCEALAQRGVSVSMVISSRDFASASKDRLRRAGVRLWEYACGPSPRGLLGYFRMMGRLAKEGQPGTVLYSNGISSFIGIARRLMRSDAWVHHHHGDVTPELMAAFSPGYRAVLSRCDCLITCTAEHARLLDAGLRCHGQTRFLPVITDEPSLAPDPARKPAGQPCVIGFFGRIRASKGVPTLLSLASWFQARNIECRLHGDDCERLLPAELPAGITWAGAYDSGRDLDRLMSDVDIVVLPTTFPEGLPAVISEAISRGVPVVAYDGGGVRHLADFHPGLAVTAPDPEQLKTAIARMCISQRDPKLRLDLMAAYHQALGNQVTLDWWMTQLLGPGDEASLNPIAEKGPRGPATAQ